MYMPEKWTVVKITTDSETYYKIFATWYGSYLAGPSWRMNSGIDYYITSKDKYHFYGDSGSIYICHKQLEGISGYGASILHQIRENFKQGTIEEIPMKEYRKDHAPKSKALRRHQVDGPSDREGSTIR